MYRPCVNISFDFIALRNCSAPFYDDFSSKFGPILKDLLRRLAELLSILSMPSKVKHITVVQNTSQRQCPGMTLERKETLTWALMLEQGCWKFPWKPSRPSAR